jgi:hypothetical protein
MLRNAYIVVFCLYSAFHCIRIAQQVSWRNSTSWRVRFDRFLAVKLFPNGKKLAIPGKVAGCFHLSAHDERDIYTKKQDKLQQISEN